MEQPAFQVLRLTVSDANGDKRYCGSTLFIRLMKHSRNKVALELISTRVYCRKMTLAGSVLSIFLIKYGGNPFRRHFDILTPGLGQPLKTETNKKNIGQVTSDI